MKQRTRIRGDGRVFPRGNRWWIAYYVDGVEHRESGGLTEPEAWRKLSHRRGEIDGGRFVGPQADRLTVAGLIDERLAHLALEGRKSLERIRNRFEKLKADLGAVRVKALTTARVEMWMRELLDAGYARGTVKNLAAYLGTVLRHAERMGRIAKAPYIPSLRVDNARQGFFEADDFERLCAELPAPLDDIARFGHLVGWRKSEIVGLQWSMVDRVHHVIRLPDSKTDRARVVPLTVETPDGRIALALGRLIEKRWKARALGCPYVFHANGKPALWINHPWNAACKRLGLWRTWVDTKTGETKEGPTKVPHDLRRTAYRNLIEAGVDPFTAMDICGHETPAMAKRYAIKNTRTMGRALLQSEQFEAARGKADIPVRVGEGGTA